MSSVICLRSSMPLNLRGRVWRARRTRCARRRPYGRVGLAVSRARPGPGWFGELAGDAVIAARGGDAVRLGGLAAGAAVGVAGLDGGVAASAAGPAARTGAGAAGAGR